MKALRVVVVDDSAVCRELLGAILEEEGDIEVVGEAADGCAAIEVVARSNPDLVTLDVEMPAMDGLLAVEQIMAHTPVPILIVTGRPAEQRGHILFDAVQRGALDLIAKPRGEVAEEATTLRALVRSLARIPVIRHIAGRRPKSQSSPPAPETPTAASPEARRDTPIVGVAASAGGPAAVNFVVGRLPPDFQGCVAVVQHLLPGFASSFVDFLRLHTRLRVQLALQATRPSPGTVLVAPDYRHLVLSPAGTFVLSEFPARGGYRPSADVLFQSLAETCGPRAIGVVLSGIGDDGAAGLLAMRKAGAATFAQDEASCAVFGMPHAAWQRGAVAYMPTLDELPSTITRRARQLAMGIAGVPRLG
jgi:two-component system chemotaxis response regulator CheB